jgi:putative ABC transport system ATP-binding protein
MSKENKKVLIQLKNIYKTYYTGKLAFEALKDINLEINTGEYVAILGPSGSGKSTMMQIIGCLSTPTSGQYFLDGSEVSKLSRNELAKIRNQKIGFVFQSFNLLPQMNIIDSAALPLLYRGVSVTKRQEMAREILGRLGLSTHLKHRPNELSGGQKQRVAIARAVISHPALILADEPTGNLDSKSGADVVDILEQFYKEGNTVITVTHDLALAKHARRIVYIHDGRITKDENNG